MTAAASDASLPPAGALPLAVFKAQPPTVFRREVAQAVRYERGLLVKAVLMLAVVAIIVILRTLYFALRERGLPMWVRKGGIWQRVVLASVILLALTAAVLTVSLSAEASSRADGRELAQRLVPASAASVDLLSLYQAQQNWLRDYVTAGHSGPLTTFDDDGTQIRYTQDQIAGLVRGQASIMRKLDATRAAYQAWLADVAGAQLAAMARGEAARAQTLQGDIARVRPYVLAIRSAGGTLQGQIATAEQTVTSRLTESQDTVLYTLIAMCVVAAAIAVDRLMAVWFGLVRPSQALRAATDAVAAGDYSTKIPVIGPAELADLARGIELMRTELVKALTARERALTARERAEQRFRGLFDGAPDPMIAVAPDGSIAMANARAGRLFGCAAAELIGRKVETLVPEKRRQALARERRAYFAAPVSRPAGAEFKVTGLRGDGGEFPAEVTVSGLPMGRGMLVTAAIRAFSCPATTSWRSRSRRRPSSAGCERPWPGLRPAPT
ncbi:MAG: PAS domain S-box protein [Streptosporangiaceae bacterium]